MQLSEIKLSVALVTRNRPASLERTLISIRSQGVQPWEIVISDDSDDEQAAEVASLAENYECRYLSGPRRGLYANRNCAALACLGTHIRTMDDDHEFPPEHFQICLNSIHHDRTAIWVIGEYPVMKREIIHKYQSIRQFIIVDNYTTDNIPETPVACPGQLNALGVSEQPDDPQHCWAISDGASLIPKSIFDRGLRYAECYPFGASYLEFGSRLHWLGYRMRHLTSTFIIHHSDPTARSFMNEEIELSSRVFALLCHSFIYQPTPKNKLMSSSALIKQLLRYGKSSSNSISLGWSNYLRHRDDLNKLNAP